MSGVNYTALVASQCKAQNRVYAPQIGSYNYNVSANALLNATGLNRTTIEAICPPKLPGGVYTETLEVYISRITTIMINICEQLGILPMTTIPPTQAPTSTIKTTSVLQLPASTTPITGDDNSSSGEAGAIAVFMFSPAGIAILLTVLALLAVGVAIAIKHTGARRRATIPLPPAPPPTADEVARAVLAITEFPTHDQDSESTGSNYVELDRVSRRSIPLYDAATMNAEGEKDKMEHHYDTATA